MAFTQHDTPEVVARIQSDLDHIVRTVRRGDPWLRSLVLTGGFARGEGAVLDGQPQNDYDLVAVRGLAPPNVSYDEMRQALEETLGMHIDLAPISGWRLRWVDRSIFWYETAVHGSVLWGDDLLGRLPVREAADIDAEEGLRLLVNRAAGLLLYIDSSAEEKRLQAAKALLGALDVHLLALGEFAPSHTERWARWQALLDDNEAPDDLVAIAEWLEWAFRFKMAPDSVQRHDGDAVWRVAARAVHEAVPVALQHAEIDSLDEYATHDGLPDRVHYYWHAEQVAGADRRASHPTGNVRVATLRLLAASLDGSIPPEAAHLLDDVAGHRDVDEAGGAVKVLDDLRGATLQ